MVGDRTLSCRWASDVDFDGIRLEVFYRESDMLFDVSVPDDGSLTVNTFGKEVAADILVAAIEKARQRR